jgi:GNAT superfamily N-acetyltransferase
MRIVRLVEEPDWRDVLPQIDAIFFATSAVQNFRDDRHRASFRVRWLGRYLEQFQESFFIARAGDGTIAGYLAGCLANPAFNPLFDDTVAYKAFAPWCATYPSHLHVNVDARFRNLGVGTGLIEAFSVYARGHRAPGMHVITDKGRNEAFYKQIGFRPLAVTRSSGIEVLFMGKKLEISRNAQCPCGSGKKYKHCHGATA